MCNASPATVKNILKLSKDQNRMELFKIIEQIGQIFRFAETHNLRLGHNEDKIKFPIRRKT